MSHNYHQPNHRQAESFREEHYGSYNHRRPAHHNLNFADFREEDYCVSKVEAPAHYQATDCCTETVYGHPGYGKYYGDKVVDYDCCTETVYGHPRYGKYYGDKVVDYEFTQTIKDQDVVVDDCVERKRHGRFNRLGAF